MSGECCKPENISSCLCLLKLSSNTQLYSQFHYLSPTNIKSMNDIQLPIDEPVKFRDERHWEQFHNTKDLALAISITFSLLLAGKHGFDLKEMVPDQIRSEKITRNTRLKNRRGLRRNTMIYEKRKRIIPTFGF